MASVTLKVSRELKEGLRARPWINWSSIAREEVTKKRIFEEYLKKHELSDLDWAFCERIDWHPVDELPLRREYIKKLEKARREKPLKLKSVDDLFG